ncbi:hypothetical protein HN51_032376, partial [Arachis hypogaea]
MSLGKEGEKKLTLIAMLCWDLWRVRNAEIFEGERTTTQVIFVTALKLQDLLLKLPTLIYLRSVNCC